MKATRAMFRPSGDGTPVVIPQAVAQRAMLRFEADANGCHISTYSVGSHGYAQVGWSLFRDSGGKRRGRMTTAHRAAWVAVHGQIPQGMTVDHLCRTKRCVNVDHLRLLSNVDNASRNHGLDWPVGDGQCVAGHPAERRNTEARPTYCRDCRNEDARRRRAARREARA